MPCAPEMVPRDIEFGTYAKYVKLQWLIETYDVPNVQTVDKKKKGSCDSKLGLILQLEASEPFLKKHRSFYSNSCSCVTQRLDDWRCFSTQKCYNLTQYVRTIFFAIESTMNLKIETSRSPEIWRIIFFSLFHWTLNISRKLKKCHFFIWCSLN